MAEIFVSRTGLLTIRMVQQDVASTTSRKERMMEYQKRAHDCATYGCGDSRFKSRAINPEIQQNSWQYQIALARANSASANLVQLMTLVKSA